MRSQAERLIALGAGAVLIKGGHGRGPRASTFWSSAIRVVRLPAERIATDNTHGTGCTLSSAVAAGLAKGMALTEAVRAAKSYVTERDQSGRSPRDRRRQRAGASFSSLVVNTRDPEKCAAVFGQGAAQ